jgi:formate dehydrogenase iron-sulfur subunit
MKEHAAERIEDLKSRGFEHAGLYDPEGVGGTHVMYVLHHNDKPSLYAGLPDAPAISPLVSLWKGLTKPLGLLAMGAVVLAGFFHYTRTGPNRTEEDEEPGPGPESPVHKVDPSVHGYDPRERK